MNDPGPHPSPLGRGDSLSSTLQAWRHEPSPAPGFNDAVWSRIRASRASSATEPARVLRFPSALPLAAGLAIILSLAAGAGGAFALNRTVTTERMAAAYVRTVDPVQMTAFNSAHASAHP